MSFDLERLAALVTREGQVVRVIVADTRGSTPRGRGTEMLVWASGQEGTIGGGTLEYEATRRARAQAIAGINVSQRTYPLGPDLGQCCGGAVTLVFEVYDTTSLPQSTTPFLPENLMVPGGPRQAFLPSETQRSPLWIWGAGHVGRALVSVLAPLERFEITWVDTTAERFPSGHWPHTTLLPTAEPARLMVHAPSAAQHFVVTYSHDLDLALCDAGLRHGAGPIGLIGSQTKWTRFAKRLGEAGHDAPSLARITCPIGDPTLGKDPQAIAVGVASHLLAQAPAAQAATG